MTRHQVRVLLCAGAALGAMAVAMFVLGWFRIGVAGLDATSSGQFEITLRSIRACTADGMCVTVPIS